MSVATIPSNLKNVALAFHQHPMPIKITENLVPEEEMLSWNLAQFLWLLPAVIKIRTKIGKC